MDGASRLSIFGKQPAIVFGADDMETAGRVSYDSEKGTFVFDVDVVFEAPVTLLSAIECGWTCASCVTDQSACTSCPSGAVLMGTVCHCPRGEFGTPRPDGSKRLGGCQKCPEGIPLQKWTPRILFY